MSWLVLTVAVAAAFVIGFAAARAGTWIREVQLEARLRGLANELHAYRVQDGSGVFPAEWICDTVDDFVRREFAS